MRARNPRAAAHAVVLMLGACALLLAGFALVDQAAPTRVIDPVTVPAVLVALLGAAVFALVAPGLLDRLGAFVLVAVLGVVALTGTVLAIGNPSVGSQAFLALPVLYAGFQLR